MMRSYLHVIEKWSQTYYGPISNMPEPLQKSVGSLYLCLRAIDEIEDSMSLNSIEKINILQKIIKSIQNIDELSIKENLDFAFSSCRSKLPDVTLRLVEWISLCPDEIRFRILDCTASMAERMIPFVRTGWSIKSEGDLSQYFYAVAGTPGLCLSDIWQWYERKTTTRKYAISFGFYLQGINVLRGREQDALREVSFFPESWGKQDMIAYTLSFKPSVENYITELSTGISYNCCLHLYKYSSKILDKIIGDDKIPSDGYEKP